MRFLVWSWLLVALFAGALAATVSARPLEPAHADGITVRAVEVHGFDRVPTSVILSHLGLRAGATFDASRMRRGRADLLARGDLAAVDVRPLLAGPDSLIVVVALRSRPNFAVRLRGGRAADGRLVGGASLFARGNAGRGEHLRVDVVQGGEAILGLAWEEPRPSPRLPIGFRLAGCATRFPEPAEDGTSFERTEARFAVLVPRGPDRFELEAAWAEVRSSVASTRLDPNRNRDRFQGALLRYRRGERSDAFDWGAASCEIELGAWNGDAHWREARGAGGIRLGLAPRCVAALDLGLRLVGGTLPRSERLHLGRDRAPRALPYAAANGDAAGYGNLELQFPLTFADPAALRRATLPLALHVFADGGMAWGASAPGAIAVASRARDARLRWSAGVGGTAWLRRSVPCRLDLGMGDDGVWRVVTSVGLGFD